MQTKLPWNTARMQHIIDQQWAGKEPTFLSTAGAWLRWRFNLRAAVPPSAEITHEDMLWAAPIRSSDGKWPPAVAEAIARFHSMHPIRKIPQNEIW